jgi:uncharacterized protein (TIGR02145 family)
MKTRILLLILVTGIFSSARGQNTIELTFIAFDSIAYVQLDSIKIMNRTQGGETVLYWPDTALSIYYVGMPEISKGNNSFQVFQNYPNPVADQTTVSLYVPEKDKVSITVTDILGRMIVQTEKVLDKGKHSFRYSPGSGNLYFFTARWQGQCRSIRILQAGFHSGGTAALEYTGSEDYFPQLKAIEDIQDFSFSPGDELLYIGYAGTYQSGMLDSPEENTTYIFRFDTNIPCPGTPMVYYEGQVYNTIKVFSQCWLKENLNVGTMIPGSQNQSDNGIIEKYCYENEPDSCAKYGGLYQWNEVMQYTTQQGTQGICPPGWHLPTDEEWKVLEGAVDSQHRIGDPEWDTFGLGRGYDAGTNLKTSSGWGTVAPGTDLFDFAGLPGGFLNSFSGFFQKVGIGGNWWASSESNSLYAWNRGLSKGIAGVDRLYNLSISKAAGFSIRCLRDY